MRPIRSIADSRINARALANAEPTRFRLMLLGLAVVWAIAWVLVAAPLHHHADSAVKKGVQPAIAQCEPGTDSGKSALLRCIQTPADNRLKEI